MKPDARIQNWLETINDSHSWLPLGVFLLALLFTPLGTIWWLCLLIVAGLFLAKYLKAETALLWALVTLAGGILSVGAWSPRTLSPALRNDPNDVQSLDWNGMQKLEIRGYNGTIRVSVRAGGGDLRLERKGGASVSLEKNGDTLRLTARRPFFSFSSGVDITLDAPANLNLNLQNSNGHIRVEGVVRQLIAKTSNGRIELRDSGKTEAKLETSNAEIILERVGGDITAKTSNAPIRLLQSTDVRFGLTTSNADLQLEQVVLANNSTSSLESSNGTVQLINLKAPSGMTIRGSTSNAKVEVDLPGFEVQIDNQQFSAKQDGFGMANVEVRTSNKRIVVR